MKLYGIPPTRALRPIWLINELGIDCEIVAVDLPAGAHQQPAFLAINPAGKVPALVDGDIVVTESVAIQYYLAEKHPEAGFIPSALADRAEMHRWNFFLATDIEQPLWRIALNTAIYPEGERVAADIPNAQRDCRRMLAVFEKHMQDRAWVAGNRISVADFNAAYTLDWAGEAGLLDGFPRLGAYLRTMYARPAAPPTIKAAFAALRGG
ncbi:MAG: glutathione S-transferase family protein [Alphaproteobacteria bacterium]|nr:glutathione S-transferase family protein [Alphaproteobacteria bacterium]